MPVNAVKHCMCFDGHAKLYLVRPVPHAEAFSPGYVPCGPYLTPVWPHREIPFHHKDFLAKKDMVLMPAAASG